VQTTAALALPPRHGCSTLVSWELRYDTCSAAAGGAHVPSGGHSCLINPQNACQPCSTAPGRPGAANDGPFGLTPPQPPSPARPAACPRLEPAPRTNHASQRHSQIPPSTPSCGPPARGRSHPAAGGSAPPLLTPFAELVHDCAQRQQGSVDGGALPHALPLGPRLGQTLRPRQVNQRQKGATVAAGCCLRGRVGGRGGEVVCVWFFWRGGRGGRCCAAGTMERSGPKRRSSMRVSSRNSFTHTSPFPLSAS
jgi:hypothetical protein